MLMEQPEKNGMIIISFMETSNLNKASETGKFWTGNWCFNFVHQRFFGKQRYCHCELLFRTESDNDFVAFGVYTHVGVYREHRDIGNALFTQIYLAVPQECVKSAYLFCVNQQEKKFDGHGARMSSIWAGKEPTGKKWWTGSFILSALHHAGILTDWRVGPYSVDEIVGGLRDHPDRMPDVTSLSNDKGRRDIDE